jgi:hypothetical protein
LRIEPAFKKVVLKSGSRDLPGPVMAESGASGASFVDEARHELEFDMCKSSERRAVASETTHARKMQLLRLFRSEQYGTVCKG